MSSPPARIPEVRIYSPSILDRFRDAGVDLEKLLERISQLSATSIHQYPDASVQLQGNEALEAFWNAVRPIQEKLSFEFWEKNPHSSKSILGGASYLSLDPFDLVCTTIIFCGDFVSKLLGDSVTLRPSFNPA